MNLKKEKEIKGKQIIFKARMAETFTISNGRHSVVQRTPERLNTEKAVPRHIIIKLKKKIKHNFQKNKEKKK